MNALLFIGNLGGDWSEACNHKSTCRVSFTDMFLNCLGFSDKTFGIGKCKKIGLSSASYARHYKEDKTRSCTEPCHSSTTKQLESAKKSVNVSFTGGDRRYSLNGSSKSGGEAERKRLEDASLVRQSHRFSQFSTDDPMRTHFRNEFALMTVLKEYRQESAKNAVKSRNRENNVNKTRVSEI
uniref:Uncharacterized protein n=1 Tax=Ascaris lumbricoides TaxID=6252 RepID=A0A0M3HWV5_ASCLU